MFLGLGVGTRGRTRGQSHGLGAINMSGKPIGALDAFSRGSREARRVVVASGLLQTRGFLLGSGDREEERVRFGKLDENMYI